MIALTVCPPPLPGGTGRGRLLPTPDTGISPNGHGRRGGRPGNGHESGSSLDAVVRTLTQAADHAAVARGDPGFAVQWGDYESAIRRCEQIIGRPAPPPAEPGPGGRPCSRVMSTRRPPWSPARRGAAVIAAGASAGLIPVARCVALLAGLRGGRLIARPSFFQLDNLRRARRHGQPWHLIVHEDILIFRAPVFPCGSRELKGPQQEPRHPVPGPSAHVAGREGRAA